MPRVSRDRPPEGPALPRLHHRPRCMSNLPDTEREGNGPAPSGGLTRAEAQARAQLIAKPVYAVELDLTVGAEGFDCTAVIRFGCRRPGAETFIDLAASDVRAIELNGAPVGREAIAGERI